MAILVTGGAGYIGSHMVWALVDAGHDVAVIDRLSAGFRWAVAPQARFYLGNVGDTALLEKIFAENAIDAIIHFAASIVVPESVSDPLSYYENNTGNTRALLSAAVKAGIPHFVFSSTAAVYGTPDVAGPVLETAPLRPENPYGQSKVMSEIMLRDTAKAHDFRYVALRYFNVAGADPAGRSGQSTRNATHLIKVACEAALGERAKVDVYGTDYSRRPTEPGSAIISTSATSWTLDLKALEYRAQRRSAAGCQLRLRQGVFSPRSAGGGWQGKWPSAGNSLWAAPRGRCILHRCRLQPGAQGFRMDTATRRSRLHRQDRARLGASPGERRGSRRRR